MKIAIAQTKYSKNIRANIQRALTLAEQAGQAGAGLLVYPEWFVGLNPGEPLPNALTRAFAEAARHQHLVLVLGSIRYQVGREKAHQIALVFGPDGETLGGQEKVHFYRKERPWFQPGAGVTPIETPLGRLVVLMGQDGLAEDLYPQVQAAQPTWLVLQANDQVLEEEPAQKVRQMLRDVVAARSRELGCVVVLAAPVGEFYGYTHQGGSLVGVQGAIVATGPATDGLTLVEVPFAPQSKLQAALNHE